MGQRRKDRARVERKGPWRDRTKGPGRECKGIKGPRQVKKGLKEGWAITWRKGRGLRGKRREGKGQGEKKGARAGRKELRMRARGGMEWTGWE